MMYLNFTSSEDHTFPLPSPAFHAHSLCFHKGSLCATSLKAMGETATYHEAWAEGTLWHRRGVHQELIPMFDSKSKFSKTSCIIVKICWEGCLFFIYYISTASKLILCKVFWQVLRPSVCVVLKVYKLNSQIWKLFVFLPKTYWWSFFRDIYKKAVKTHLFCFKTQLVTNQAPSLWCGSISDIS